jgi:hypothetical protein
MCDYSLQHVKSRPASVSDKLTVTNFSMGTRGFAGAEDCTTAVCLLPGTELAFAEPVKVKAQWNQEERIIEVPTARFRQVNKESPYVHHDALEFAQGDFVLLTHLVEGQTATVLQLPAAPKNDTEVKDQERLAVVA